MIPTFSRYPSGTILLGTKTICSKRMRRLITFSVHYMLGNRYISCRIAKRTKSKNRMQITEFPARLRQHKRVLREIQGM